MPTIDSIGVVNPTMQVGMPAPKQPKLESAPELGNFKGDPAKMPIKLPFVKGNGQGEAIKMVKNSSELLVPKLMRKTTSMDSQKQMK